MPFRSKIFRTVATFSLVFSLSAVAFADTIRLKDGSIIKGKIVGFTSGKFTVSIGEGSRKRQLTFAAGEIESIDFESPRGRDTFVPAADRNASTVRPPEKKPPVLTDEVVEAVNPEPEPQPINQPIAVPTNTNKKVSFGKPVELAVKVMGDNTANGWTNSGWVVRKGQRIRISGTGEVSIGRGKKTGPSGLYDLEDSEKLLKSVPTGALIAVIGDDNNEFIYVGAEREFTATRDGALFLGLNEGNLSDNTGSFDVKVEISPDGGE